MDNTTDAPIAFEEIVADLDGETARMISPNANHHPAE